MTGTHWRFFNRTLRHQRSTRPRRQSCRLRTGFRSLIADACSWAENWKSRTPIDLLASGPETRAVSGGRSAWRRSSPSRRRMEWRSPTSKSNRVCWAQRCHVTDARVDAIQPISMAISQSRHQGFWTVSRGSCRLGRITPRTDGDLKVEATLSGTRSSIIEVDLDRMSSGAEEARHRACGRRGGQISCLRMNARARYQQKGEASLRRILQLEDGLNFYLLRTIPLDRS